MSPQIRSKFVNEPFKLVLMKVINERGRLVFWQRWYGTAPAHHMTVKQSSPYIDDVAEWSAVNNESYGSLITDAWEDGICCQSGQVNQLIDQDVNKPRGASQRAIHRLQGDLFAAT